MIYDFYECTNNLKIAAMHEADKQEKYSKSVYILLCRKLRTYSQKGKVQVK